VSSFIGTTIYAIGAQVGLEFLGLGDLGAVTWGTNLYWASNDSALLTGAWWTFVPTGACVALVGFALTLVSTAIDEVTNPRLAHTRVASPRASATASPSSPAPLGAPLLSVRNLHVAYDRPIVQGVSFDILSGELFGLAGESGSGKSTIGHAILRLLPPSAALSGRIRFDGVDIGALDGETLRRYRWQEVAIVFQSAMSALNPVLSVGEQFWDTLAAHGPCTRAAARRRAGELLAMVGLDPRVLDAYPHTLSGGMRQRVVLALALALRPRLLILDEPTTALDVVVQRQILERLVALQRELRFAVLFISHDLPLMMSVADRIGVLRDGQLVELATVEQLRTAPAASYTRVLLAAHPSLPPLGSEVRR